MRTVRVRAPESGGLPEGVEPGDRRLLLKISGDACLVRDPATGERRYLPADRLERVDASPLDLDGDGDSDVPAVLRALAGNGRAVGLLVELVSRAEEGDGDGVQRDAATPVRVLLDATTLCESDLHGVLAEVEAAGLVERVERSVGGRAYRPTDRGREAVDSIRDR
ncbi:hypothetical protein BRD18_03290 [Halobacteriales archaeon SW_7_71_33]|nr:MAG: hypothetical protein BRD18_03290 [Halobacteriales archaeon SW_7_71_33]